MQFTTFIAALALEDGKPHMRDKTGIERAVERTCVGMQSERTAHRPTHEDLDACFPSRLKDLRKALGLSAANLDRRAGFCNGTTGRLERGEQRFYASHLQRICTATGLSIDYFYSAHSAGDTPRGGTRELEKQRLLQAYIRIKSPSLKRDVFELVESLADECTCDSAESG